MYLTRLAGLQQLAEVADAHACGGHWNVRRRFALRRKLEFDCVGLPGKRRRRSDYARRKAMPTFAWARQKDRTTNHAAEVMRYVIWTATIAIIEPGSCGAQETSLISFERGAVHLIAARLVCGRNDAATRAPGLSAVGTLVSILNSAIASGFG